MQLSDNRSNEILNLILEETERTSISQFKLAEQSLSSLFDDITPDPFNKNQLNKYPTVEIDDDFNLDFIESNPLVVAPPKPLLVSGIDPDIGLNINLNNPLESAPDIVSEEKEEPKDINPATQSLRDITSMLTESKTEKIIEQNFVRASIRSSIVTSEIKNPVHNEFESSGLNDILNSALRTSNVRVSRETVSKLRTSINRTSKLAFMKSPLGFIKFLETNCYLNQSLNNKYEIDPLSKFISKSILNINAITITDKPVLCSEIKELEDDINTFFIDYTNGIIYKGGANGIVHKFSIINDKELDRLDTKRRKGIICLDVYEKYIVCGFNDGYIAIIDEKKAVELKEQYHKSAVIAIKIVKAINKDNVLEFISSDMEGNVFYLKYKDSFITSKFEKEVDVLTNLQVPIYLIDSFYYGNNQERIDIKKEKKKDIYSIIILASLEMVYFFQLRPNPQIIFKYPKPKILSEQNLIQDIAIGRGYVPMSRAQQKIRDSLNNTIYMDYSMEVTLFVVSWGNTIKIFSPVISMGHTAKIQLCAHFVNDKPILRIGFLSSNYIYMIDNHFCLKILSTNTSFEYGDITSDLATVVQGVIVINDHSLKEANIYSQNFLVDKKANVKRETFSGSIMTINRGLMVLGKNQILVCNVNNLYQCLDWLKENDNWEKLLCFCIEVFQRRNKISLLILETITSFNLLEQELPKYQNTINEFLESYVIYICKNRDKIDLKYHLMVCLDFCEKIGIMKFFFDNIYIHISAHQISGTLFDCLEGFIFKDRLRYKKAMSETAVVDMIKYYVSQKKSFTLSKLLLHLNVSDLNPISVRQSITENDLVNAYIYLCMNIDDPDLGKVDYFKPIECLFMLFCNKEDNPEYTSFMMTKNEMMYNDEIVSSKQYYGHRLLWYCTYCFGGTKYPPGDCEIDLKDQIDIKIKIFLWMITENVMEQLLRFDSYSYFEVFSTFYLNDEFYKIISINYKANPEYCAFIDKINPNEKPDNISPLYALYKIINKCNRIKNSFILLDLYEFLAKVVLPDEDTGLIKRPDLRLGRQFFIDAVYFYLEFDYNKGVNSIDPFLCHVALDEKAVIANHMKNEKTILKFLFNINPGLIDEELDKLIKVANMSTYSRVNIELYTFKQDYQKVYEERFKVLNEKNLIMKDENKVIKINLNDNEKENQKCAEFFGWINQLIIELFNKKDVEHLKLFKKTILDHLIDLCHLSIPDVILLVTEWFKSEQEAVIDSLKNDSSLQLDFLKRFLQIKGNAQSDDDDLITINNFIVNDVESQSTASEENISPKLEYFYSLLIQLLCQNGEKDSIFKILQEKRFLCNQKINDILVKEKVYESAVYVYYTSGGYENGLQVGIAGIKEYVKVMKLNLGSGQYIDAKNKLYMKKTDNLINLCTIICHTLADDDSFLTFLKALYDIKTDFNQFITKPSLKPFEYEYSLVAKTISNGIESVIEKMDEVSSADDPNKTKIIEIIELIEAQIKEAGHKEFRKVCLKVFYSHMQVISLLDKILTILKKQMRKYFAVLTRDNKQGKLYNLERCPCIYCGKELDEGYDKYSNKGVPAVLFICGHIYHEDCCAYENDEKVCYQCRRTEIENALGTVKNNLVLPAQKGEEVDEDMNVIEKKEKKDNKKRNPFVKKAKRKMEAFRKKFNETQDLIISL